MTRPFVVFAVALSALAIAAPGVSSEPPSTSSPQAAEAVITQVQAKLFFANSGRFSSNLFEKKDLELHNVVIGEGGVEGPSENTILVLTVTGSPKGSVEGLELHVTARTASRALLDRKCEVGIFNTNGNWYAPFMLYDTGCEPVEFKATLGKGPNPQVVTGIIPFSCSE